MFATLVLRGATQKTYSVFPLFYSYITYAAFGAILMYVIYWLYPAVYPRAFWFNYLVNALAEFAVLVEISDHIFRPFVVIRSLGRAVTVLITAVLGIFYVLPALVGSASRSQALTGFALRTFVTKGVILVVLFFAARHYRSQMGRNVAGLMLGFSIYVAINVAMFGSAQASGSAMIYRMMWFMSPLASALCILVWVPSLWNITPVAVEHAISPNVPGDSESVTLGMSRLNNELTKILHR